MWHAGSTLEREPPRVTERDVGISFPPGRQLAELIAEGAEAGCPVWLVRRSWDDPDQPRAQLLAVPRLWWTSNGYRPEIHSVLPWHILQAMETGVEFEPHVAMRKPQQLAKLLHLQAAVLRDVLAVSETEIAKLLRYGVDSSERDRDGCDRTRSRSARDAVEKGRQLWAKVGAWPWWCYQPPDGKLPDRWWSEPAIIEALAVWRG